jgi:peptidoglycan/LPS O-acetylase OafA/YrhL
VSAEGVQTRWAARIAAGALCLGAAALIVGILSDASVDGIGEKVFWTIAVFPIFLLCSAAGLRLAERRPRWLILGLVTVVLAAVAYLAFMQGYWSDDLNGRHTTRVVLVILALATAQASLVLASARDDDGPPVNIAVFGSLLSLAVLTALVIAEVSEPSPDVSRKAMGVFAVLYVLGLALVPLLRR